MFMNKPKLSSEELIEHLKTKGVLFSSISEEEAMTFITDSTYFYRLASYRENFIKNEEGKYVDLDFGCLVELSRLDKKLRYILFKMCIDVEHSLKTKIVDELCSISDGYLPVKEYFNVNPDALTKIQTHHNLSSYSYGPFSKYNPNFPVWVFVELASFGTITSFCNFIDAQYGIEIAKKPILNSTRDLRNAIAHNSCLLRNIVSLNDLTPCSLLYSFLSTYGIGKDARRTLTNKFVNDLISLIYLHKQLINDPTKYNELRSFIKEDAINKSKLFSNNSGIKRVYEFLKRIFDKI